MLYFIRESMEWEFDHILGIFDNEDDLIAAFKEQVERRVEYAPNYITLSITQVKVTNTVGEQNEIHLASLDDYTFLCVKHINGFNADFNSLEELRAIDKHARDVYDGYMKEEDAA